MLFRAAAWFRASGCPAFRRWLGSPSRPRTNSLSVAECAFPGTGSQPPGVVLPGGQTRHSLTPTEQIREVVP